MNDSATPDTHTKLPVFLRVKDMKKWRDDVLKAGLSIGFVPTMGALHDGHAFLIRKSCKKNDVTVVSIFVNPTQFNDATDLETYPRTFDSDLAVCEAENVSAVFAPTAQEMYGRDDRTVVEVHGLTDVMCGMTRAGHFRGVCTVVTKLLNIVRPTRAYFGEKDIQQLHIIKRMVSDLMMDVDIVACPIVRDPDGLAISSRNKRLTPAMRAEALVMAKKLQEARERFNRGEKSPLALCNWLMEEIISGTTMIDVDYAQFVRASDMVEAEDVEPGVEYILGVAVNVGRDNPVRLIDNVQLIG